MKDLWILVADADIEATMQGLLTQRQAALGIRDVKFTIMRHQQRDPGCRRQAGSAARSYASDHHHALVVFDKAGSGDEGADRQHIQEAVEEDLRCNGWENRSKAIVIEPELEIWVWSTSPHVGTILGWNEGIEELRGWLHKHQLWPVDKAKPPDPKSALRQAMREQNGRPRAATFMNLARSVGLNTCNDPAFRELRNTLRRWFPASPIRGA